MAKQALVRMTTCPPAEGRDHRGASEAHRRGARAIGGATGGVVPRLACQARA